MAINLLDMLKEQMTDAVIGKAANFIGESNTATKSAVGAILPTILGSVISKGSTQSGAGRLLNMIADGKHDGSIFDNIGSLLGGGNATTGFAKSGGSLLSSLLGNNLGSVADLLMKATGLKKSSNSMLMNLLAPMVMGMIGRYVNKKALNAGGLMDLLLGQKKHVSSAMPAGMGSLLGFADTSGGSSYSSSSKSYQTADNNSGGGWWKWLLLGLLALLALGYFGMRTGCSTVDNAATTVTNTTGDLVDATGKVIKSVAGYTRDAAGNLVDKTGKIIYKAGEYTVDAAGNIVDGTGKILEKTGQAIKSAFNYTKDAAGNLVDATGKVIYKAGEYTVDAAGNIVDGTGKILRKAGEVTIDGAKAVGNAATSAVTYTKDAAGNLVDKTGKIIYKAGEFTVDESGNFLDRTGKAIGGAAKATGKAIGNAAEATGDALKMATTKFQTQFTDMFKKADKVRTTAKAKGGTATKNLTGTITYKLTDIVFKDGSARVETFTKAEVEGLAAALKAYPKAKIQVQTSGDNKALAGQRATAVHDMLAALGVDKKQLSHKGVKGGATKVEIVVE